MTNCGQEVDEGPGSEIVLTPHPQSWSPQLNSSTWYLVSGMAFFWRCRITFRNVRARSGREDRETRSQTSNDSMPSSVVFSGSSVVRQCFLCVCPICGVITRRSEPGSDQNWIIGLRFVVRQHKVDLSMIRSTFSESAWFSEQFEFRQPRVEKFYRKRGLSQAAPVVIFWPLEDFRLRARYPSFWLLQSILDFSPDNSSSFIGLDGMDLSSMRWWESQKCTDYTGLLYTIWVNGNAPDRTKCQV